jgi:integrase
MAAARKRGRYGHRDATMILIAYRHGLGVQELVDLQWNDVDLDAGRIKVRRLKGSDDSVQPLTGAEIRALRRVRREQGQLLRHVFTSERGEPLRKRASMDLGIFGSIRFSAIGPR